MHTGSALPSRSLPASAPTGLWLAGREAAAASGRTFAVTDPATDAEIAQVADAGVEDARAALDAGEAVRSAWAARPPGERADILLRAWELTRAAREDLARTMTLEMGKPLAESRGEVDYAASFLRWFAEEAVRPRGEFRRSPAGGRIIVTRVPVGICLAITPWNFPLAMATRKVGPALAAGCPIIVKPARATPLTMLLLGRILHEAGVPAGVVSILPGSDPAALTAPLLADARLRKLTFTGSTTVGRALQATAAERLLRTSMELGGNAPFLVFEDADLDAALAGAAAAKLRNGGEACTAANRFHVHRSIAADFAAGLAEHMAAQRLGHGLDEGTDIGPLISAAQVCTAQDLVDDAVRRGARVLCGGGAVSGPGHFFAPTVLADVPAGARILREEVFAPVAPISVFDDEEAGIRAANDTEYGLAAYAYTRDLDRALRLTDAIEAGMLGINRGVISDAAAPFGGIKESGLGREGGREGLEEYTEVRYVAL